MYSGWTAQTVLHFTLGLFLHATVLPDIHVAFGIIKVLKLISCACKSAVRVPCKSLAIHMLSTCFNMCINATGYFAAHSTSSYFTNLFKMLILKCQQATELTHKRWMCGNKLCTRRFESSTVLSYEILSKDKVYLTINYEVYLK